MKILHIELGRHLYGGAKQVAYLIDGLAGSTEFEQHLICAAGSEVAKLHLRHCSTHAIPYSGELDIRFPFRLGTHLAALQPDIIHIHSRRGADLWGAIAAGWTGIPAICTRRVDNPEKSFNRLKYSRYKAVVSISQGVKQVVSQHCSSSVSQPIIHSAVDLKEYAHQPDKARFHAEFSIPANNKILANFAQLIPRKGQKDLIEAMVRVIKECPNVTCLLFGKGKQHDAYQEQINNLGLAPHVRLCGFTEDVPRILPNIDLLVHPAHAEGLGVILLQAGACRLPVVSCPSGGIPEIIRHNETGFLVPAGEPARLASQINEVLSNPEIAKQTGEALYTHVKQHFSVQSMASAYAELYHSLLNE